MELLPLVQALYFMVCIVYWNKNIKQQKKLQIYSAPKSLDKFIINFDNNELDNLSGSFRLNLV